jgi:hypothetical protein
MSMNKVIIDCETGNQSYVPLTAGEISAIEQSRAADEALRLEHEAALAVEAAARDSARAKLAALGLTEAEVAALVK